MLTSPYPRRGSHGRIVAEHDRLGHHASLMIGPLAALSSIALGATMLPASVWADVQQRVSPLSLPLEDYGLPKAAAVDLCH